MKNRVLSVHQEHELLLKLEQAGLNRAGAQAIIESKGNAFAKKVVEIVQGACLVMGDWFSFTTTAASLRQLRDQNPELFYKGNDWWFSQPFALKIGKYGRRIQLRISEVPGSFSKTLATRQLLFDGEIAPTVRDMVEGMIIYYLATGERILSDCWIPTLDISTDGYPVDVGFGLDGVYVLNVQGDGRRPEVLSELLKP